MKYLLVLFLVMIQGIVTAQHSIVLKSGDKLEGVVMGIQNDTLSVFADRKMHQVPLVKVSSIFFSEHVAYDGSFDPAEEEKSIQSGEYLIHYQMKDRVMEKPPVISNATENKGKVVVDIKIDRYGIVQYTKAGAPGSTTSNDYLYIKAEFAAKGARFNEHIKGPLETKGTITIDY